MKASREDLHQFEYGIGLVSLVVLVAGLNILDVIFTQVILATGGTECNPVVRAAIDAYGDRFWIWKVTAVSSLLVLICLYSRLKDLPGDPCRHGPALRGRHLLAAAPACQRPPRPLSRPVHFFRCGLDRAACTW